MRRAAVLSRSAVQTRKLGRAGRPAWKCAEDYKRWLRKLPCAACGCIGDRTNPVVSAHVDHAGGKGIGTKVADRHCLPLCDRCHQQQHIVGWPTFERTLEAVKAGKATDAVVVAAAYWDEWPDRRVWERELAESGQPQRGAL